MNYKLSSGGGHRQPGQTTVEEQAKRDLKAELEDSEAKHFKQKAGDVFEGAC